MSSGGSSQTQGEDSYLRLPVRKFGKDRATVTVLNRLDNRDLAKLAASPNLRGLRYLDLEDQKDITLDGFRALAASPHLPELSAVVQDIYDYRYPGTFSFGTVGRDVRELHRRLISSAYTEPLEAEFGRVPWLRVAENYGRENPDIEAVVEHPVALRRAT